MIRPYDDIINLPHHVSASHPQMLIANRAAQFSPFGALTGYDAAIKETARLTDEQIELEEHEIDKLDRKLNLLFERMDDHPKVTVTYFQPDGRKKGGAYVEMAGAVKKIDDVERVIVLMNGARIPIASIIDVDGKLFEGLV